MKVSIITVVYNGAKYLEQAMQSVLSQRLPAGWELEYVVIDGGSTDGTVEIIEQYADKLAYSVSEPDGGIYDAMNKGVSRATGEVVGILNADDFYVSEDVLGKVIAALREGIDAVYGDIAMAQGEDTEHVVRYWQAGEYTPGAFRRGWHPPHPALFVRRSVYQRCGLFNICFKIAADYEFMLRIFEVCKVTSHYIPELLVKMRVGGASTANLKNILKANVESYRAWQLNHLSGGIVAVFLKPLGKVRQLFTRA